MPCPKCGGKMKLGFAIRPRDGRGLSVIALPLINVNTLRKMKVAKCESCGHSDDDLTLIDEKNYD
jgi:hypothetical protein